MFWSRMGFWMCIWCWQPQQSFIWPKRRTSPTVVTHTSREHVSLDEALWEMQSVAFFTFSTHSLQLPSFLSGALDYQRSCYTTTHPCRKKWPVAKAVGRVTTLRTHVVHLLCEVCCMQTKCVVKDLELSCRNATGERNHCIQRVNNVSESRR